MVWSLFPFKDDFSVGKSQKSQGTKSGLYRQSHLGDLMFLQKLCMRSDAWAGTLLWWSCQSPGAHSYGLLNHPNSFHRGMFNLNAKFHPDSLLYLLVLLNVMATQDTCSLNGIYRPHWLVQWSRHRSHTHSPVHSPWLPGYINVTETILVILTMTGLFPDRPRSTTRNKMIWKRVFTRDTNNSFFK